MKALWISGLLFLLAMVVYGRLSVTASGAGELRSETRAARAVALPLPSSSKESIALDASSHGLQNSPRSTAAPAPPSMSTARNTATALSAYVFLHRTRNESIDEHAAPHADACAE